MSKFKFSYDEENDDLFLYNSNSRSKGSVEIGNLIMDYNNKKEFVGLQIINASKFLKDISNGETLNTIKKLLKNLKDCKMEVKPKNNLLIIKVYLFSKMKEISPVLSVPLISESSPALACT